MRMHGVCGIMCVYVFGLSFAEFRSTSVRTYSVRWIRRVPLSSDRDEMGPQFHKNPKFSRGAAAPPDPLGLRLRAEMPMAGAELVYHGAELVYHGAEYWCGTTKKRNSNLSSKSKNEIMLAYF